MTRPLKIPTKARLYALQCLGMMLISMGAVSQSGIRKNALACSNSLGDPVYSLDFGSGPNFGPALAPGTTSLAYQQSTCPNDEFYAIVNSTPGCFNNEWHNMADHTGNANGYFMLANASAVPNDFFVKTITGLCEGNSYEFAAWIANLCKFGGILPNLTMTIETPSGTVIGSYNTGDIPIQNPYQWQQYGFDFTTPAGVTSVVLRMRNNAPGGSGNDVALDDISFRPIGPNITLSVNNYGDGTNINLPEGSTEVLLFTSAVENCYALTAYQWQVSTNNGASWTNIAGATGATYLRYPTANGNYLYRLVVAQVGNINNASCRVMSSNIVVNVAQACSLVVNNPVPVCAPATVNLTLPAVTQGSTNLGPLTYWTNAAATTPLSNPTAISVSGTYYIKTEGPGCMEIKPVLVFVNSNQPTATPTLYCAPSPAFPTTQLIFDWNNNIGETGYTYSYSIDGGPLVYGAQNAPSSQYINVGPGVTVTFNIYWNGLCATKTATCTTGCVTTTTTNFAQIAPFCAGTAAPVLSNTSPNGVVGTWSPSVISNTASGSYVFTPTNACATSQTLNVTVLPSTAPTFTQIGPVCQNSPAFTLPTSSNNPTPVTGTWSPAVSTATVGATTYTFTPNPGQCNAGSATMTVTVLPNVTPNFAPISPLCEGSTPPVLSTTSPNGITGTWSPSAISTTTPGTANYTFTPNPGQCADPQTLAVTTLVNQVPNFTTSLSLCSGSPAPVLQSTSPNGISGTWNPSVVSNTVSGNYIFTPSPGQCASTRVVTVTVIPTIAPNFPPALSICQGNTPPPLSTTSPNGISGTWSPSTINTANLGTTTYTFTATAGQCVSTSTQTFTVDVIPNLQPDFLPIDPFCAGTVAPILSNTSPNGVTGTWSPPLIDNMASGTYTFTPTSTQCASPQTLNVTVTPRPVPTFSPVPAFCTGGTAPVLPTTSNNGFTGTWSPATVDNTTTGIYIFTPDAPQCAATATLTVTVNQPVTPDFPNISICEGETPPALEFQSPNEINGSWMPVVIDNYNSGTYVFTPVPSECAVPQTITVTVNTETLTAVDYSVTNAFLDDQVITVLASGPGNYLYQLDNGPLQASNVFPDVPAGTHSVTVYDANGCSAPITNNNVRVINYPAFFTPNGDSHNDTWNVIGLTDAAAIFIFDRHGKLLKQISPTGAGWDGTYNGEQMPSSDYWFTVDYNEQSKSKTFRAHFTLKR